MAPFQPDQAPSLEPSIEISLPYQTTSYQAVEALNSESKLSLSQRKPSGKSKAGHGKSKTETSKNKSSFSFCICGGNTGNYNDGNDMKMAAATVPPVPNKTIEREANIDRKAIEPRDKESTEPHVPLLVSTTAAMLSIQANVDGLQGFPPPAKIPSVPLADHSDGVPYNEPFNATQHLSTANDDGLMTRMVSLDRANKSLSLEGEDTNAEDSQSTVRPDLRDHYSVQPAPVVCEAPGRHKHRGGFIAIVSSDAPVMGEGTASSQCASSPQGEMDGDEDAVEHLAPIKRMSIASTASQYSMASPYIQSPYIPPSSKLMPDHMTMGIAMTSSASHLHEADFGSESETESVKNMSTMVKRSSWTSTDCAASLNSSISEHSSERSPAIGEVLAHFPSLAGIDGAAKSSLLHSISSSCPTSEVSDNDTLSSRVNTFGLLSRRLTHHDDGRPDSPARINSFHYDDDFSLLHEQQQSPAPTVRQSCASSTPSSDRTSTADSSIKSHKSQKRAAVMYGLPSHTLLSTLSREAEKTEEDAWNPLEKVVLEKVTLEKVERVKQERPTTAQSMHSDKSRTRSSSSSQTPSCPPPDVPLPPVPGPNSSAPTSHRGHAMRSCNSLTSREKDHFLVAHQPPAHHSMGSVLPRSTTCPQLSSSDGYAL